MFFRWKVSKRDDEIDEAMAGHDEAIRQFQDKLQQAEEDHSRAMDKMLRGLLPKHKGDQQ